MRNGAPIRSAVIIPDSIGQATDTAWAVTTEHWRAAVAILDITGVKSVDGDVADALVRVRRRRGCLAPTWC
ncbi:hypothetical protein ACMHYB_21130 [Sorangium sp. So ce1128]